MQLPLFQKQVTEAGFMTAEESDNLKLSGGVYTGSVRGVPFRAVHPKVLPAIEKSMVNLYRAQFLIQSGRKVDAMPLIKDLQTLTWSTHYHEGIPGLLAQMANSNANPPTEDPKQE